MLAANRRESSDFSSLTNRPRTMFESFFARHAGRIIALVVLTAPLVVYGALQALESNRNDPDDWLPAGLPETQEFLWFAERFGGDEVLIASWNGCTLDDPRLVRMEECLKRAPLDGATPFLRVVTGQGVYATLISKPISLAPELAKQRMRGWLLGADGETTCAVMMVDSMTKPDRNAVMRRVKVAAAECGIPAADLYLGGPTADAAFIDQESTRALYGLSFLSIIVGAGMSWFRLRSVRLATAVFATSVLCEGWSLAVLHYIGQDLDAVLTIMPALVYVLSLCASIHLLACYRETFESEGANGAADRAVALAWRPTCMAAVTTALGLVSLCVSEVLPVRRFGAYSALGVCLSLPLLFGFLPALLEKFRLATPRRDEIHEVRGRISWEQLLAAWAARRWKVVIPVCLLMLAVMGVGLLKVRTSVRLPDMFLDGSSVIQHYRRLEAGIGPLVPVDVVLRFDAANCLTPLERLELAAEVAATIDETPSVDGVTSAATFVPEVQPPRDFVAIVERTVTNRRLIRERQRLVEAGYLADDQGGELWLVNGRIGAFVSLEYGELVEVLRTKVGAVLDRRLGPGRGTVRATVCGGIPLVSMVQKRLLNDLATSFTTAILMIGGVLAVALRNVWAATALLLPNVLPIFLVFGCMGLMGISVDLGSVLTASTALGITVDNELHFVAWYRRALSAGVFSRSEALAAAFGHCGKSMIDSAVITGLGMLTFALSTFVPTARFGGLMFLLIFAAMFGDLLLLPALIGSPIGRWFGSRPTRGEV